MNIISLGLATQKQIVEANKKVIPIPTKKMAEELRKEGKVIVHRPNTKPTDDGDDFPPQAA